MVDDKTEHEPVSETTFEDDSGSAQDAGSADQRVAEATIISDETSPPGTQDDGEEGFADDEATELFTADEGAALSESAPKKPRGLMVHVKTLLEKKWSVAAGAAAGMMIVLCFGLVRGRLAGTSVKLPTLLPVQMVLASIEGVTSDVFYFDKFLIVLPGGDERAYVSLGISVIPSGKAVYREIASNKAACRLAIYDALRQTIVDAKPPGPSGTELRGVVSKALDRVLRSGRVESVELYDYTAV